MHAVKLIVSEPVGAINENQGVIFRFMEASYCKALIYSIGGFPYWEYCRLLRDMSCKVSVFEYSTRMAISVIAGHLLCMRCNRLSSKRLCVQVDI